MEEIPTIQNESDKKLGFNIEFEIKSDKNNIYSLILNADTYFYLNIKATQKNDNLFKLLILSLSFISSSFNSKFISLILVIGSNI